MGVWVRVSIVVISRHSHKWKELIAFSAHLITGENQGGELKAEAWRHELKQKPWRSAAQPALLYTQDHLLMAGTANRGLGPLTSFIKQDPRLADRPTVRRHFLN